MNRSKKKCRKRCWKVKIYALPFVTGRANQTARNKPKKSLMAKAQVPSQGDVYKTKTVPHVFFLLLGGEGKGVFLIL